MDENHATGGSHYLGQLIDDYGDCLVADLFEVYHVDLRDLYRDDMSPRWLLTLITQLPAGSRFYAQRRGGPQFRGWDESRYALVAAVNAIRSLQYTYVSAHSKRRPTPPKPMPIPDDARRKKDTPGSFAHTAKMKLLQAQQGGSRG